MYISASKGGSSIEEWQPGRPYYNDSVERLKTAKNWLITNDYSIRHCFVLWSQGETDGDLKMEKSVYKVKLIRLLENFIKQVSVERWFLIGTGNHRDLPNLYAPIRHVQFEVAETIEQMELVSQEFLYCSINGMMKDEFHYTQEAYNRVGKEAGIRCGHIVNCMNLKKE